MMFAPVVKGDGETEKNSAGEVKKRVGSTIVKKTYKSVTPLTHHITNFITFNLQTFVWEPRNQAVVYAYTQYTSLNLLF